MVVLTALLVVALIIISSLTAPSVNAPSNPLTPAPIFTVPPVTGTPIGTPGSHTPTLNVTQLPTARPHVSSTKATGKVHDIALSTRSMFRDISAGPGPRSTATRRRFATYFGGSGNAYHGRSLCVRDRWTGLVTRIGNADPYVHPVWSAGQRSLLFVRLRHGAKYPGARWLLLRYDRVSQHIRLLTVARGLALTPLGWRHARPLYLLAHANSTDSSLYTIAGGRSRFVSMMVPQAVDGSSLAPYGRFIAFMTPADCSDCALAIFDMSKDASWFGPTGIPSQEDIAWTPDGRAAVTLAGGVITKVDASSRQITQFSAPHSLPHVWADRMIASTTARGLRLIDTVTGRVYEAGKKG